MAISEIGWLLGHVAVGGGIAWYFTREKRERETRTLIQRLHKECEAQGHQNERLSQGLIKDCFEGGSEGAALITFAVGVANMGVSTTGLRLGTDPAGDSWRGRPAGLGKHLTDFRRGGLLGPHIDSTNLLDVYDRWGYPPGVPRSAPLTNFNQIIRSDYSSRWLAWAGGLVQRREVIEWSIDWWITKFWRHPNMIGTPLPQRIARARIANSRTSWITGISKRASAEDHNQYYYDRKYDENPSRISRTVRQIGYVNRAIKLWEIFR